MNQPAEQIIDNQEAAPGSVEAVAEAIPTIEENIVVELQKVIDDYTPIYNPNDSVADQLNDKYVIHLNEPKPHLNTKLAEAFKATSVEPTKLSYYALVCPNNYPRRKNATNALKKFKHPNMVRLRDCGVVRLSSGEHRFVYIYEEPKGQTLAQIIEKRTLLHEKQVKEKILTPLVSVLKGMRELGVSHGRVNPGNIYLGERVILGECCTEPTGLSQPYYYEPLERMLCNPISKGAANQKTDVYALAMLTYELMFGNDYFSRNDKKTYTEKILTSGSYNLLTPYLNLTETLEDLFRGVFNELKLERWGLDQMDAWLQGKRYNLIHPSLPRDSSRPFEFAENEYFSLRALANILFNKWATACRELGPLRLDRWLEMSAHKPDIADTISYIIPQESGAKEISHIALCKVLSILDYTAPIRYKEIAVSIDGLGPTVHDFYINALYSEVENITRIIEEDIPVFVGDNDPNPKPPDTSHILWLLQRVRQYLKHKTIGYGVERILYDLNASLPCQSSLVKEYCVDDLETLLKTLDFLSKQKGVGSSLLDRHLAAYLSAHLDLVKDLRIQQLAELPILASNPEIIIIKLLGQAQEKYKKLKLVGLASWCAIRISEQLNCIHNRKLRRQIRTDLKDAAKTGRIAYVLGVLFDTKVIRQDRNGFSRATNIYDYNKRKMKSLEHGKSTSKVANELGLRTAIVIAYTILGITSYILFEGYMGW